jgi:hypothetical protein
MNVIAWRLDADGVFVRNVVLASALEAGPTDVIAKEPCDLPAGKYRWTGTTMLPLAAVRQTPATDVPSLEEVVFRLARMLEQSGQQLPARVDAWQRWYRTTVDVKA